MAAAELDQLSFDLPTFVDDPWRRCPRCVALGHEGWYPIAFFRFKGYFGEDMSSRYHKFCMGCEDESDRDRLLRQSLAKRVARHAKNFGLDPAEYRQRYGMDTKAVLDWFKTKWNTGRLDCGCHTSEMHHGWRDAEIDQRDPEAEPFFPANWQLMCSVHNNSKGRSRPEDFAARQRGWELFRDSRAVF